MWSESSDDDVPLSGLANKAQASKPAEIAAQAPAKTLGQNENLQVPKQSALVATQNGTNAPVQKAMNNAVQISGTNSEASAKAAQDSKPASGQSIDGENRPKMNGERVSKPAAPSGGFSRDKLVGQAKGVQPGDPTKLNNIVPKKPNEQIGKAIEKPKSDSKPISNASKPKIANGVQAGPNLAKASQPGALPKKDVIVDKTHNKPLKPNAPQPQNLNGAVKPQQKQIVDGSKPSKPNGALPKQGSGGLKRVIPDDSDSEDDVPLNKRVKTVEEPVQRKKAKKAMADAKAKVQKSKKRQKPEKPDEAKSRPKRQKSETANDKKVEKKWDTLHHCGVLFPPDYKPHGVKMLYDGRQVDLTPEQEEVASMYGVMIETDYAKKKQFNENFWAGFKKVLGKDHAIKSLEKCDFRPMYEHFMAEREAKKALTKEEKVRIKSEKDASEAKYKVALVDGRKEGVGNFRVEPPGLFRGRGEHPKMGQLKRRIYPRDITINIGKGQPIPDHPYPGQKWKEIRHDNTVTWLAYWKDPISTKDFKYVWLAANSTFKSDSDLAKYEKARKLKTYIDGIRSRYQNDWKSKDVFKQQMGVALYFIDKLALRAGHEKDEDEADTVGCCTLKVENVDVMEFPENHIKFDFLGKDSIRYENEVEVDPIVWKLVKKFCASNQNGKAKTGDSQVFELLNATDLNNSLKDLMDGLSVKVFRTYNASITLDRLLYKDSASEIVDEKKADYDRANKEVAILCNHQRAVPKGHTDQMERLADKLKSNQEDLDQFTLELKVLQGKAKEEDLKEPLKKAATIESTKTKITRKKEQLAKLQVQSRSKEDLKTVALGTSKINYLDPRITISWCKRQEVPIEKIFNKSLLSKFHWAMDAEPEFKF